jgi:hypothetical protein
VIKRLGVPVVGAMLLLLGACGGGDSDADDTVVVTQDQSDSSEQESNDELPDTPQAYSTLTVIGDEAALPEGTDGEVTVVAISEPDGGTSFPFILHNGTDQAISRIEVSGRAQDADGATLGTGVSQSIEPNVVLPDRYAIGYVYVETSDFELPAGSSIPDLRIQFEEGLSEFENIIGLDVENVEQLKSGDLVGDVTNPHDVTVSGPISVATVCLTSDGTVSEDNDFTDGDTVPAGGSVTWTISAYGEKPKKCAVRLVGASGYEQ